MRLLVVFSVLFPMSILAAIPNKNLTTKICHKYYVDLINTNKELKQAKPSDQVQFFLNPESESAKYSSIKFNEDSQLKKCAKITKIQK